MLYGAGAVQHHVAEDDPGGWHAGQKETGEELATAIEGLHEAINGGAPMSPEIARKGVLLFRKAPPAARPSEALTAEELRLLQLLADGHSYQAAAERLDISLNTVRSYVRNVYDKLHVHSKSEAVSKALRSGLIV